jgi:hypothetical protein
MLLLFLSLNLASANKKYTKMHKMCPFLTCSLCSQGFYIMGFLDKCIDYASH